MKNATKNADELKSLFKRLTREGKVEPKQLQEPLKALVRAAMSFEISDAKAEETMKAIEREFVDLNELRVATELEVQEMLGSRYPQIEARVAMITASLNYIFEREHTLSLDRLKTLNKKEARQFLRDLPGVHPFVEAFVMLHAFDGAAMPMDEELLSYLQSEGVLGDGISLLDAQKFIENNVKGEEVYDFYAMLRRATAGSKKKK